MRHMLKNMPDCLMVVEKQRERERRQVQGIPFKGIPLFLNHRVTMATKD